MRSATLTASDLPTAQTAFSAVFREFDPYGRPFQSEVPGRLLIYDVDRNDTTPWGLSANALDALVRAAGDRDLQRVFISVADPQTYHNDEAHYVLSPLSVDSYAPAPDAWTILPHAMYPPSGAWGVLSSDESHILVGGAEPFIAAVSAGLGRGQDEMIDAWLEEWSAHQDRDPGGDLRIGDWIPAQIVHVLGTERAELALGRSRLRRWDLPAK